MPSEENLLGEEEVAQLPLRARVAFAARCARYVLPVFERWEMANEKQLEAVTQAIELAEKFATDATWLATDTTWAATWAATWASRDAARATAWDAACAARDAWDAAGDAARAARDTDVDARETFRRELLWLANLAKEEQWNDLTPIPRNVFDRPFAVPLETILSPETALSHQVTSEARLKTLRFKVAPHITAEEIGEFLQALSRLHRNLTDTELELERIVIGREARVTEHMRMQWGDIVVRPTNRFWNLITQKNEPVEHVEIQERKLKILVQTQTKWEKEQLNNLERIVALLEQASVGERKIRKLLEKQTNKLQMISTDMNTIWSRMESGKIKINDDEPPSLPAPMRHKRSAVSTERFNPPLA